MDFKIKSNRKTLKDIRYVFEITEVRSWSYAIACPFATTSKLGEDDRNTPQGEHGHVGLKNKCNSQCEFAQA